MEDEQEDALTNGACSSNDEDFFILDGIQTFHNDDELGDPSSKEPLSPIESKETEKDVFAMDGLSNNFMDPPRLPDSGDNELPREPPSTKSLRESLKDINADKNSKYLLSKSVETNHGKNSNVVQKTSDILFPLKNVRKSLSSSTREYNGQSLDTKMKSSFLREVNSSGKKNGPIVMEINDKAINKEPVVLSLNDVLKSRGLRKILDSKKLKSDGEGTPPSDMQNLRQYRIKKAEESSTGSHSNSLTPGTTQASGVSVGIPAKAAADSFPSVSSSLTHSPANAISSENSGRSSSDHPLPAVVTKPPSLLPVSRNCHGKKSNDFITTGKLSPNKTSVLFFPVPVSSAETVKQENDKVSSHVPKPIRNGGGFTPKNLNILPSSPPPAATTDETSQDAAPDQPHTQSSEPPPTSVDQMDSSDIAPIVEIKDVESLAPGAQKSKEGKKDAVKEDSDVTVLRERPREAKKKVVTHTIEDGSDSDVCIVKEDIKVPFKKKVRVKKRSFKCSECDFKANTMGQLKIHERAHPKGRKIKCSKCPFETRLKSCMIYHAAMHSGRKQFRCSKCNFETDIFEKFSSHENQKFSCAYCDMTFHLIKELKNHISEKHNALLGSHAKSRRGRKPKSGSGRSNNVKSTKKSVEKEVLKCTFCSFQTFYRSGFLTHLSTKHRKVRYNSKQGEYECDKCSYVTDERLFLEKHMRIHSRSGSEPPSPEKQLFKCTFCDFETEFGKMMQNHMITHSESDSDFDMDNDCVEENGVPSSFASPVCTEKYHCSNCSFRSNSLKVFEKHKSLHQRRNVFKVILNSMFES